MVDVISNIPFKDVIEPPETLRFFSNTDEV